MARLITRHYKEAEMIIMEHVDSLEEAESNGEYPFAMDVITVPLVC